ncbi:DUF4625 domain-containing protein [Niabella ginsengisoli]|uniref:DUF4625 domain-containing protein n=1 Tax=Niabella ginsengisoli TaxID=522298 RepID=A0ABS9SR04_9BACT|nr:DUF4625 domain-containing protein [Niabella ginsengisoli]MCH5600823.1 DUF4625 domain-containing protein [Niabella ginsengisoli]
MKTKNVLRKLSIALLLIVGITACNKEDVVAKPTITDLEVGADNNKKAYPGTDIHIEGDIVAPGTIASIKVEIHPESGTGWTFDKIYTDKYAGTKNAEFHEHIDIPTDAAVGEYHVHIAVTDKNGNVAEVESDLDIIVDPTIPSITNYEVVYESAKNELHVEGTITASNKIAELTLEIHGGNFEKEYAITGSYVGNTTFNLHQHFSLTDVPAGHYHVHLLVKDQAGKEREFEEHFDK